MMVYMLEKMIAQMKDNILVILNPTGSSGTGIMLDSRGIIVTNSHVVEGTSQVGITTNDRKRYLARVLVANRKVDFAFLLCPGLVFQDFPVLASRTSYMEGEDVIAIGHPLGLDFTVSKGIISSSCRQVGDVKYIQTDVPINPGNSGGPLIDIHGEIIGINTWIISDAQGLSFAVPSTYLADAYRSLPADSVIAKSVYCISCGRLGKQGKYCSECGIEHPVVELPVGLFTDTGICHTCKKQNAADAHYCTNCGGTLLRSQNQPEAEEKTVSLAADAAKKTCQSCGTEKQAGVYCSHCGTKLDA